MSKRSEEVVTVVNGAEAGPIGFEIAPFNNFMRQARRRRRLSQEGLAKLVEVETSVIGDIENLRIYPDPTLANDIALCLGETREEIFPEGLQFFTTRTKSVEIVPTISQLNQALGKRALEKTPRALVSAFLQHCCLDGNPDPADIVEQRECRRLLVETIRALPPREKAALVLNQGLHDGIEHSYQQIGKRLHCSPEQAESLVGMGLFKMREAVG